MLYDRLALSFLLCFYESPPGVVAAVPGVVAGMTVGAFCDCFMSALVFLDAEVCLVAARTDSAFCRESAVGLAVAVSQAVEAS